MFTARRPSVDRAQAAIIALGLLCFLAWTWTSYVRWADFEYRTFDLAYYVQAIWQLIHGRFRVSVQYVPLLGNHVEPIVFLAAPFFFLWRHPMLFVVLQNAALATMGPVAYRIGTRLGLGKAAAVLLAAALLLTPASGYIALHEFHPEALTAPLLLLMLQARLSNSLRKHWLWFVAVLACKENMALLLAGYCAVQCVSERKLGFAHVRRWYVAPLAVALIWFVLCTRVITPALNSGNIDYGALYDRLGASPSEILCNAIRQPGLIAGFLSHAISEGNLVFGLFLPLLCLPVLRPKWILIVTPIYLQHLLSWRSSEWTIYFHYAAPILPLLWIATAEAIASVRQWTGRAWTRISLAAFVLAGSIAAQFVLGPAAEIVSSRSRWFRGSAERARKSEFIAAIPADASVLAPLPYLSHLAMREELHSLHYVLKGLKTLSREPFTPPLPPDYVLIDYGDSATFDAGAGFYHPTMRKVDGLIIPSSDQLLHNLLKQASWRSESADELTRLRRVDLKESAPSPSTPPLMEVGSHTKLLTVAKSGETISEGTGFAITLTWQFEGVREIFPWMCLQLTNVERGERIVLVRGLCAPEASTGSYDETWSITSAARIRPGHYALHALFFDNAKRAWSNGSQPPTPSSLLVAPIALDDLQVLPLVRTD